MFSIPSLNPISNKRSASSNIKTSMLFKCFLSNVEFCLVSKSSNRPTVATIIFAPLVSKFFKSSLTLLPPTNKVLVNVPIFEMNTLTTSSCNCFDDHVFMLLRKNWNYNTLNRCHFVKLQFFSYDIEYLRIQKVGPFVARKFKMATLYKNLIFELNLICILENLSKDNQGTKLHNLNILQFHCELTLDTELQINKK
ncbi:hypothetical protein BpHYR1_049523 [Brachionus plicatilis]|uniref:Uncharacterized protein n=1 Tax=Brachionus plicatilis TaxID=10195 RepID=A0A3M7REK3_BRAPC|nr:hypothetical protein BpHYR1_049523 [Brachionus plicatilis]